MATLGELEQAVMETLWFSDVPLTVREVHERLKGRELAYTTVMTVLQRLAKKGLTEQHRVGKAHSYSAARSRNDLVATLMIDALGESGGKENREAALLHFVSKMAPGDADALRSALFKLPRLPRSG